MKQHIPKGGKMQQNQFNHPSQSYYRLHRQGTLIAQEVGGYSTQRWVSTVKLIEKVVAADHHRYKTGAVTLP